MKLKMKLVKKVRKMKMEWRSLTRKKMLRSKRKRLRKSRNRYGIGKL